MAQITTKENKREQLLTEGVNLLMAQGYHGTGLKEILQAVKIPKGSFYNYFDSKEKFAAEIIAHYIEPYIERLETYLNRPELNAMTSLQCYLHELIEELQQAHFKGGCLLGNLMGEIGDTSEICRTSLKAAVKRYRKLYIAALERGQQEGSIRTDKSATIMADLLINGFQGALLRMKIEQSTAPLQQCCDELLGDYFKNKS